MSFSVANLTVENSIDAPLSTQVNNALSTKYDASNPSGFQTAAQVSTAASSAVTSANSYTDSKIAALTAASPAALDTLAEIATALGNDPNFATTVTTGLSNRLRVDTAAQGLSGTQKINAKTNIDLQNVDNTSDLNKPISTATQTALNLKYDASNPNNYETPTQLNARDTANRSRANHTGTQVAATISDFSSAALSIALTGISFVNSAVVAADTILAGFGKLQGQITQLIANLASGLAAKADNILTGIVFTNSNNVSATDTVNQAIGKLQAQNDLWNEIITTTALNSTSAVTLTNITQLGFTVVTGKTYYVEYTIMYQSVATTTGITFGFNTSDSGAGNFSLLVNTTQGVDGTGSLYSGHVNSLGDLVTTPSVQTAGVPFIVNVKGIFVATANGTMVPQFRSEVAGSQVTVMAGSVGLIRTF
jgi:hypothetical protein